MSLTRAQLADYHAACATFDETVAVLRQWAATRLPTAMAAELSGLADCLTDAHGEGSASVSATDMRDELTLCPDSAPHFAADCSGHDCPAWIAEGRP